MILIRNVPNSAVVVAGEWLVPISECGWSVSYWATETAAHNVHIAAGLINERAVVYLLQN